MVRGFNLRNRKYYAALLLIILVLLSISVWNRKQFGSWLPTSDPNRIEFRGRRYYPSGVQLESIKKDLTLLEPNFYWGRGLYTNRESYSSIEEQKKYETYIIIYLSRSDGFVRYTLSGGP